MEPLTRQQGRILRFYEGFLRRKGYCPSLREVGRRFCIAAPTAHEHVEHLVTKGYLKRGARGTARALSLGVRDGAERT